MSRMIYPRFSPVKQETRRPKNGLVSCFLEILGMQLAQPDSKSLRSDSKGFLDSQFRNIENLE